MAIPVIDWKALTGAELVDLASSAQRETDRRAQLEAIPASMAALNESYLRFQGVQPEEEWRQPTGTPDAYPKGWKVKRDGKLWESLIPFNTTTPGQDAAARWWKDVSTTVPPGQWAPGKTVKVGEIYTYAGKQYRVIQAHTTQTGWEPPAVPALWAPA